MIPSGGTRPMLRVAHIRQAGLCLQGARAWFKRHGWSYNDFIRDGRPVEDFEETGCPLAQRAVKIAREEVAGGDQ